MKIKKISNKMYYIYIVGVKKHFNLFQISNIVDKIILSS